MPSPRRISAFLLCTLALVLVIVPAATGQEASRKVKFETVARHLSSGHWEKKNYLINNKEEWERVWAIATSNSYPPPSAPEIDFSTRSVIAVFQGSQPSDGYSISINKLKKTENSFKIVVTESMPEDTCKVLMVVTQPFHIIETERIENGDEIVFKVKRNIRRCP
jgi:hypothetical protein